MRESLLGSVVEYPANLVDDIYNGVAYYQQATEDELMDVNSVNLTPAQLEGLNFAISTLNDQQREVIKYRYEMDMTYSEISEVMSLSPARIRDVCIKAVRLLASSRTRRYIRYGIEKCKQLDELNNYKERTKQAEELQKAEENNKKRQEEERLTGLLFSPLESLPFSAKAKRQLTKEGVKTISDAFDFVTKSIKEKTPFSSTYPDEIVKVVLDFKRRALASRPHWEETEKGHRCTCCLWETKSNISDYLYCPHCGQRIITEAEMIIDEP